MTSMCQIYGIVSADKTNSPALTELLVYQRKLTKHNEHKKYVNYIAYLKVINALEKRKTR